MSEGRYTRVELHTLGDGFPPAFICADCGALVWGEHTDTHDRFHVELSHAAEEAAEACRAFGGAA